MTRRTSAADGEVTAARWTAVAAIIAALIGASGLIIAAFIPGLFTLTPESMESPDSTTSPPGSLLAPSSENSSAPGPGVVCVIKIPSHGERVQAEVSAIGTVANVAAGQKIWLIVQSGSAYYPQASLSLPPNGTGGWTEKVYFGGDGDTGNAYTLYAVVADEAADNRFANYIEEVERDRDPRALEAGRDYPNVPVLAQVTVVRE